jgi:uncharacterized protein (TIGR02996 family)
VVVDEELALRKTVALHPHDDLPRLVYADWLEDRDQADFAHFIRGQIELAKVRSWSPEAVYARRFKTDLVYGRKWRAKLPSISSRIARWEPNTPYQRGFPEWLVVRDLISFLDHSEWFFEQAPITRLSLPSASLATWREFFRLPKIRQIRAMHFYGISTPIEAIHALAETDKPFGLKDIAIDCCSGRGISEVLGTLLASPTGKWMKRLRLASGGDADGDWVEGLEGVTSSDKLQSLSLTQFAMNRQTMTRFRELSLLGQLKTLKLSRTQFDYHRVQLLLNITKMRSLQTLRLHDVRAIYSVSSALATSQLRLRCLDLANNPLDKLPISKNLSAFRNLKSLNLSRSMLDDASFEQLGRCDFWPGLVELNLHRASLSEKAIDILIASPPTPEMVAIILPRKAVPADRIPRLEERFGDALILAND